MANGPPGCPVHEGGSATANPELCFLLLPLAGHLRVRSKAADFLQIGKTSGAVVSDPVSVVCQAGVGGTTGKKLMGANFQAVCGSTVTSG